MAKFRRFVLPLVILGIVLSIAPWVIRAFQPSSSNQFDITYELNPQANFFGQVENTTPVPLPANYANELATKGYVKTGETDRLELYVRERFFQIAVYDKLAGYLWYSVYPDYLSMGYSGTSRYFIESGVVIEYYNLDNILIEDSKSYVSGSRYNVDLEFDYDAIDNGVKVHLTFDDLAIKFDVDVYVEGDRLVVHLPMDSLWEGQIEKPMLNLDGTTSMKITKYRLKSVYLFPYFGANNHQINGYAMVPDGSGALIRYTDRQSATAYIQRIYGTDEGNTAIPTINWTNAHWKDELTASMPIFGINHGYHQAAFAAILESGDANAEIHSYPFGYNSYQINTTFMKFIVRERYTIRTSSAQSDSFQLVNETAYPADYTVSYRFLAGEKASYSGMAEAAREAWTQPAQASSQKAAQIKVIAQDYKNGLFGKTIVAMTTYEQLIDLVRQMEEEGLSSLELEYFGWNKGGFYDNPSDRPAASGALGGETKLKRLEAVLQELGIQTFYTRSPLIAYESSLGQGVVKKVTLVNFETARIKSSLFQSAFYRDPALIAKRILDHAKAYERLGVDAMTIETVGQALFSYRTGGVSNTRDDAMRIVEEQIGLLGTYDLAMIQPNSYLYRYLTSYYRMPIESNKYSYMTDSIPFLQMVLHGKVALYSDYVNYVSDYGLYSLRLVEYGVSPAFIVTAEPTYRLRHTNLEYLFTTEFALWKDTILQMNLEVGSKLTDLADQTIAYHRYVAPGIAETTYADGTVILVNFTASSYDHGGILVEPFSSKAVRP